MPNRSRTHSSSALTSAGARSKATAASHGRSAPSAAQTECVVLRMAGSLSVDAARHPSARSTHLAYITGALALAVSLDVLADDRALELRQACIALFDAAAEGGAERLKSSDPAFARVVSAVRRNGGASLVQPLAIAELSRPEAARMLSRLVATGIVGPADLAGFHRAAKEH